jgi:hypothetical protein
MCEAINDIFRPAFVDMCDRVCTTSKVPEKDWLPQLREEMKAEFSQME